MGQNFQNFVPKIYTLPVIRQLKDYIGPLEAFNFLIAAMDVYAAFATKARSPEYSRPEFVSSTWNIKGSFHPLLEGRNCIKNDILLDKKRFCVITGPNMGGKSTFIKQCAVTSILAQIGSFVPALECSIPLVDGVFLRVGANDNANKNISTFMHEMMDIAKISRMATAESLVIIDELGRGTNASDGLALATAVTEFLIKKNCLCFFATHFPEIGKLDVVNKRVKTFIEEKDVTMLYKLEDGVCNTSFGLHVAKIVEFPEEVIQQAEKYLKQ